MHGLRYHCAWTVVLRALTIMAQGTIDMRSWHHRPSHIVQDTASASLPSPTCTDRSECPTSAAHEQRESQTVESDDEERAIRLTKRRKIVGGLRLTKAAASQPEPPRAASSPEGARRLHPGVKGIPQRKRNRDAGIPALRPSSYDKLVQGIWEQIHGPFEFVYEPFDTMNTATDTFRDVSSLCLRVIKASRFCRSLEAIVQAHWVECFDARVEAVLQREAATSRTQARKLILGEACRDFGWAEKYLRNKMSSTTPSPTKSLLVTETTFTGEYGADIARSKTLVAGSPLHLPERVSIDIANTASGSTNVPCLNYDVFANGSK